MPSLYQQSSEYATNTTLDRGVISPKVVELFDLLARFDAEDKKLQGTSVATEQQQPEDVLESTLTNVLTL